MLFRWLPLLTVLAVFASARADAEELEVYASEFGSRVRPALWSHTQTSQTPRGEIPFLGEFGEKDAPTLKLEGLPPHEFLRIRCKLFIIRSADGDHVEFGADRWAFSVDGGLVFGTSFSNATPEMATKVEGDRLQGFPDEFPAGKYPAGTGAAALGELGYRFLDAEDKAVKADAVYELEFVVPHRRGETRLQFGGDFREPVDDESWGLASVQVDALSTAAVPGEGELTKWWGQLVGEDAEAAHRALWRIVACGKAGADFVAEQGAVEELRAAGRVDHLRRVMNLGRGKLRASASVESPIYPVTRLHDGVVAEMSRGAKTPSFSWRGSNGTREWVRYEYDEVRTFSGAEVFFTLSVGQRLPKRWEILLLGEDGRWQLAKPRLSYSLAEDDFCRVRFEPMRATAVVLDLTLARGSGGAISEFNMVEVPTVEGGGE